MFKILHGGRIRLTGVTNPAQVRNIGVAAMVEVPGASGDFQLSTYDGTQSVLVGPSLEAVVLSNAIASTTSVVEGREGSILLDNAIVETDEIASSIIFAVGDAVYADLNGQYTNVATSATTAFVGWCTRANAVNSDASGVTTFRFLYLPPRWGN